MCTTKWYALITHCMPVWWRSKPCILDSKMLTERRNWMPGKPLTFTNYADDAASSQPQVAAAQYQHKLYAIPTQILRKEVVYNQISPFSQSL
jgi:hypothetical protein